MAYPAFPFKSFWTRHIPTAVGGVIPNWATLDALIYAAYQKGEVVTYNDASGYQFILDAATGSEYRLNSRWVFNYPTTGKAALFRMTINRSSGAVTTARTDFTIS